MEKAADSGLLDDDAALAAGPGLTVLVENQRAFLAFLERRLGRRELAEDLLQETFARHLTAIDALPEGALIPWFYRTLRNAAIDRLRRRATEEKALATFARELDVTTAPSEVAQQICACVRRLATTLKPGYAEILEAVEVGGVPVKEFAAAKGISAGNAGIRLFRAREALKKRLLQSCGTCADHGCLDCSCRPARPVETGV